ncbi:GHKL domain-containing protein [Vagococcus fluvialis]|uniref:GHKL domain-containing protein n=1 Tax=Vagococcus fluvialis TaxID=2738 RepID=UPI001A8C77D9|nr:GHKL domain-containing protein [Vagococcus fluvialis]MBO0478238.1 GHKL domain-containing protein [Vagococcus fluvialis]MBO0483551.1 GHKL domain-containing protein [Vagococcus fluvialis]UDM71082.1 GHKL domain-containing protein [Vagococcus fluvialis]UDM75941.1 GHKL domain-containing protein [Vagococcus fluvialis]UDM82770.1 GHKL domain-containing protein [Vagococcus fluvialis]
MIFIYLNISSILKIILSFFCIASDKKNYLFLISFIIVSFVSINYSIVSYLLLFALLILSSIYKKSNLVMSVLEINFAIWINILLGAFLKPIEMKTTIGKSDFLVFEIIMYVFIILISFLSAKYVIPVIKKYDLTLPISIISSLILLSYQFYLITAFSHKSGQKIGLIFLFLIITSSLFFVFKSYSNEKSLAFELEKKKMEEEYLKNYIDYVNEESKNIKKFKHDYINILSSLEYFIAQKDVEKIETFYLENVQPTKSNLQIDYLKIDSLDKIKWESLKSILTMKLVKAKKYNVPVSVELVDDIPQLTQIKDTVLIRILGIIIDNAIEEIASLEQGEVQIAIFSDEEFLHIVVRNSIREGIEPLHILKGEGFSTKGENRGLGLSNLSELVSNEAEMMLSTNITSDFFIQELLLKEGEKI